MNSKIILSDENINPIFEEIKGLINTSRNRVYTAVNTEMLSEKLTKEFGKGFSARNLRTMRKFYSTYPIWKTMSAKLSWSHYLELIRIEEEKKNFELNKAIDN